MMTGWGLENTLFALFLCGLMVVLAAFTYRHNPQYTKDIKTLVGIMLVICTALIISGIWS